MNDEIYWNYTVRKVGRKEEYNNNNNSEDKFIVINEGNNPNEMGKYGSLVSAIKGFINDELNTFSIIKIEHDDADNSKFKLISETWLDMFGRPVNDVNFRKWKKGIIQTLTHCKVEAKFIKHVNEISSFNDYLEIADVFPDIKK